MNLYAHVVAGLAIAILSCRSVSAQPRSYTEISGKGQRLYRIAVAPVLDGGGAGKVAQRATSVLTRDLTLCGLFKVLDPKGFLANLGREGTAITPQSWIDVGAQGVIKARAKRSEGGFAFDFFLYEPSKGDRAMLSRSYRTTASETVRRVAHRFGDEVVKYFTQERGVFNTRIAFSTGHPRSRTSQIMMMDYDGYGASRVSRTGRLNLLPDWSPSGALAWTSYLWLNPDLFVLQGKRAYRISKRPGLNTGAAWSPNGKEIALTLSKDGNAEIYVIDAKGRILRRLTRDAGIDASPAWSPDGRQIAFVSNRGGSPQIYVMSAKGGSARRVTFQGNYNQEPDWCSKPGSNLVAFTARDERGAFDIFTVDISSGAVKRLTQGQGSNKSPSWAPNGRLIVFSSSRGGLWLMDHDGFNQHQIYKGVAATPVWSK